MRAIQITKPRQIDLVESPKLVPPAAGEALVRTQRAGICGTDHSSYLGKFPFFDYPRIIGHELGVEILEVGEGVSEVQPGDRCSVEPYMNCGNCYPCRRGASNCCTSLNVIGVMSDGGMRERFVVRADKLHRSEKLDYEQLALVETLAIGCHATARAQPMKNDHVLIIGAGPIGLSTLEFTRQSGAAITVMDMDAGRLDFCRTTYGFENTIRFDPSQPEAAFDEMRAITGGDLYASVTDATGSHHSMSAALDYVAPTGRLVYVGVTTESIRFEHPRLHRPEIAIFGSRNALPSDFRRCINLIEAARIDTAPWITDRVTLEKLPECFDDFVQPTWTGIKAIVEVSDSLE